MSFKPLSMLDKGSSAEQNSIICLV